MESKEVILFQVSGNVYGVEVSGMQGIEPYGKITPIANAPTGIIGITDLRDKIYPVIDLRELFSLPKTEVTKDTSYILLKSNGGELACFVDEVIGIHIGKEDLVQETPAIIKSDSTSYVDFIIKMPEKDELVVIIKPDALFSKEMAKAVLALQENIQKRDE